MLFFLIHLGGIAQTVHLKHLDKSTGAPSNFINDLCIDNQGRAILATDIGLYSYNGTVYTKLVGNSFVNQVKAIDGSLYYTSENKVFLFGVDEPIVSIPSEKIVIDFQLKKNTLTVLGQNHCFVYDGKKQVSKFSVNDPIKLVKDQNNEILIIETNRIQRIGNNRMTLIFASKEEIFDVSASDEHFAIAYSNNWQLIGKDRFNLIRDFPGSEIRSISSYGSSGFISNRIEGFELFSNKEFYKITQKELQGKVEKIIVDDYLGAWFLTQGYGVYFSENITIRQEEKKSIRASLSINGVLYWAENNTVLSSKGDFISCDGIVLAIDSWKENLIYSSTKGCYLYKGTSSEQISNEKLLDICVDEKNDFLYGTTESNGIQVINLKYETINSLDISDGLSHNYVKGWAMMNDTLFVIPKRGKINLIYKGKIIDTHDFDNNKFNEAQIIRSSFDNNSLFLYNVNGFLNKFNPCGAKSQTIRVLPGVREIYCGKKELVLVGNSEIQVLDVTTLDKVKFRLPKNLSGTVIGNGFIFDKSNLLIGTSNGTLAIGLNVIDRNIRKPSLVISEIYINGIEQKLSESYFLDYGENIIRIKSEFIDLTNLYSSELKWSVRGDRLIAPRSVQNEWVECVVYNNGQYNIEFQHSDLELNRKIRFTVALPFWKQIWFWVIVVLLFIIITFTIVRWRTYRLRNEKERLEKIVDRRTKELQTRNEDVEQIAYALSHDFKIPLKSIESLITIIKRKDITEEQKKVTINLLESKSEKLSNNMTGLIDLIKIENNKDKFAILDLNQIINDVKKSLEQLIEEKNSKVEVELNHLHELIGIQSFFFSVIQNLVSNSLKYSADNKNAHILIRSYDDKDKLMIEIQDNGIGMDLSSSKQKIFQPFKQIDPNSQGNGLGLSIVKRMIEIHRGTITVHSQLNIGTIIHISIPVNIHK